MRLLFDETLTLTPAMYQKHQRVEVALNDPAPYLYITYIYDPKAPDVAAAPFVREALPRYRAPYEIDLEPELRQDEPSMDQLITPSLSLNGRYLGASHRRMARATFFIGPETASPGFIPVPEGDLQGALEITLSPHQIVRETRCRIEVRSSDHYDPDFPDLILPDLEEAELLAPVTGPVVRCELHCHTRHSDGNFSFAELNQALRESGIQAFAMTDHNTQSTLYGRDISGHPIIGGMEWTTFWGHLLVLGGGPTEWRRHEITGLTPRLQELHNEGRALGIAHPFALGNPWCTGCFWEYPVEDWNLIDYIEVWSLPDPETGRHNARAWTLWTDLLNRGYRLAGTSGRDWHGPNDDIPAATLVLLEDGELATEESLIRAIKQGRVGATQGPQFQLRIERDGTEEGEVTVARPGDEIPADEDASCHWSVDCRPWRKRDYDFTPERLVLVNNGVPVAVEAFVEEEEEQSFALPEVNPGWLRAELYGRKGDKNDVLLAFYSPFWIV